MSRKKRKKKYRGTLHGVIISEFADNPFRPLNYKQVSFNLGIKDKATRNMVHQVIEEMAAAGDLVEVKKGKYMLNPKLLEKFANKHKYITGTVEMKETGKAYVISDEGGEDILIMPNNINHAIHGDHVKVLILPKRKNRKTEGQIVEVLKREKDTWVGVFEKSKNFGFVVPDNRLMPYDIFIPKTKMADAIHGQKVLAKISDWPEHSNNPFGEIVQVLGQPGDNDVEMQSILSEYNFPLAFPKAVEKEAAKIKFALPKEELKRRRDFRDVFTITIDPWDAKDFDDALSVRQLDEKTWEVGIHIADVSHFVKPGTSLDSEAYDRATSIYLVDRVIPMLPEVLSNGVCSLRPDEEKLTFSAVFKLNEKAEVLSQWFGKTVIKSNRRYSYEEAQKIIETGEGDYPEEILTLHKLASILREKRFAHGSINFNSVEIKFKLDEKGKPIETYVKEQKEANHLIEEFMLLANKKVAEKIGKVHRNAKAKTFVYRVHDEPDPEKLNTFVQFLKKLGYKLNISNREALARSYNELFEKIKGKGEENLVETVAIRTMAKAYYSTENIGHYGLAFPYYTHFTSPIRRYPDLMVHRLLERYLEGKPSVNQEQYEEYCKHASDMEKRAAEAERESVKYKQVEFLQDKVGKVFEGVISGVSKWGLFVQLVISKSEGLVRIQTMKDDFYVLDEDNYRIIGRHTGVVYQLGDKVNVLVKKVDLGRRQLDFELVEGN
jgi:ribonuclease R